VRRAAHVDTPQAAIVRALRQAGAQVLHLHQVGGGAPDLLVGRRGVNYLLEVKSPGGAVEAHQSAWHASWPGGRVAVVHTPEEALAAIGLKVSP
jgi:hypothetical protein